MVKGKNNKDSVSPKVPWKASNHFTKLGAYQNYLGIF